MTAALLAAVFSTITHAIEYKFSYKTLFNQLKYQDDIKYPDFKVGYFMVSSLTGNVCTIEKSWMSKKEHFEEFNIPITQEIPLPIDSHLRKVNPDIYIKTINNEDCDLSFQIISNKPVKDKISFKDVENYQTQIQGLMKDIGGVFSAFFIPEVKGVVLHLPSEQNMLTSNLGKIFHVENHQVFIKKKALKENEYLPLNAPIYKITPWLKDS